MLPLMDREALYSRLPIALQQAACSLEGWRIEVARFGRDFRRRLAATEARQCWDEARVVAYRDLHLAAFVRHCAETVPYYRRLFREIGFDPAEFRGLADLDRLPVLSKTTVQDQPHDFLSTMVPARLRVAAHTSGTTGGGLVFHTTAAAIRDQYATWWRYFRRHGLQRHTWCAYFGGRSVVPVTQRRPPYWRINRPGRQILFSGYHLSSATSADYIAHLRRACPPWIHGYPSLISLLASHVLERGDRIGYQPRWITTGAENLMPHQAELILRAFGTRPVQHYGMAEAVANISQCPAGSLHVDEDFAAVEFLGQAGGMGWRVVGTNFTNLATPLLRYDVGDVVEPAAGPCSCGLAGRRVESIDGRQEDLVVLKNGVRIGRMDHIFKDAVNVREAQIVQGAPGSLRIRVVRRSDYSRADEDALRAEFRKRLGELADLSFEYVEKLPRSRTGKLRFVVSEAA
jgi:phenylacetate-CoA ligase